MSRRLTIQPHPATLSAAPTTATTVSSPYPYDSETLLAWHIASLLLQLGRPTHPHNLASMSESTPFALSASPHHILRLCSRPNSPIELTDGHVVTLSRHAFIAFVKFVTASCSFSVERVWFRKRKRPDDAEYELSLRTMIGGEDESMFQLDARWMKISDHQKDLMRKLAMEGSFYVNKENIQVIRILQRDMTAGKRPRSMPLFGSISEASTVQSSLEFIKSEERQSLDDMMMEMDCVQDSSRLLDGNALASVMPSQPGLVVDVDYCTLTEAFENSERVEEREPIRDEAIPEKSCDMEKQGDKCLTESEYVHDSNEALLHWPSDREYDKKMEVNLSDVRSVLQSEASFMVSRPSTSLLLKTSDKRRANHEYKASPSKQAGDIGKKKSVQTYKRKIHARKMQTTANAGQNVTHGSESTVHVQEGKGVSTNLEDQMETKGLPKFESYVVEDEEGSGGYGTVYRARRKSDGAIVAIKCPHAKANWLHVTNELKMLERFGGKNFIIKYEGCFKSGSSECFVLEHVDHDRPEVLKKAVDIFQLQWYGYCLFRALASLHKQGVVHRDVKPGNFLYSCKTIKGYLIDFNLALDLYQKYGTKSMTDCSSDKLRHVETPIYAAPKFPDKKSLSPVNIRKFSGGKSLNYQKWEGSKGSKLLEGKNLKRKDLHQVKACNELASRSTVRSQGAEGSGVTSAREVSNMTPSGERVREPMPRQGRKELINLLHEAMRTNHEASSIPAPMRKRVAAPFGKVEGKHVMISPMPLHLNGTAVPGAALRGNKGDKRKEGPCVGTKGFRAPEVLLKSFYQGPKLDVWSAGVTLLYLILGKMPFVGDPEQNIKDITKLRGSEDLWEVAKLHGRESSFPMDLCDIQALPSVNIREWCRKNMKRQDLIKAIPESLYDLLDKCLTVNPRLRISAEEALKHEFFRPCLEDLRKQKLQRLGLGQNKGKRCPTQMKANQICDAF